MHSSVYCTFLVHLSYAYTHVHLFPLPVTGLLCAFALSCFLTDSTICNCPLFVSPASDSTDMMTQCWPFAGQQHHLRAFASAAFGPDTRSLLDPRNYAALTGIPAPPGHGDFGRLMGKSPAEAWALHAALTSNAEFSRRFPHLSSGGGHSALPGATNLHGTSLAPSHGASLAVPPGHPSNASLPPNAPVPNVPSLASIDPMTAAAAVHLSTPYSRFFTHGYPPPPGAASGVPAVTSPTSGGHLNGGSAVNYSPLSNASGANGLFNSVTAASSNSTSNLAGDLSHHHSPLSSLYSSRTSFPSSGEFNGAGCHHSNHGSTSSLSPSPHLTIGDRNNASSRSPNTSGHGSHIGSSSVGNHVSHNHPPPGSVHLHSPDSSDSYSIKQERSSVISDPGNDLIHPSSSASSSPQPVDHSHSRKHSVITSSHGKANSNSSSPSSSPVPPAVSKTSSLPRVKNTSRGSPSVSGATTCTIQGATTTTAAVATAATNALSSHVSGQMSSHPSQHASLTSSSDSDVNVMSAREAAAMLAAVNLHPSMYPGFLAAAAIHGFTHPNGAFAGPPNATASRYPLMASGLSSLQPSLMHFAATDPVAFAAAATGATGNPSLALSSSPSLASLTSVSSAQVISTATASATGTLSNSSSNSSGNLWRPY